MDSPEAIRVNVQESTESVKGKLNEKVSISPRKEEKTHSKRQL
jgi:hypothetical protein